MNAIFEIYRRDIKRILTNWAALAMIIGLIILPSLYAWFNIKSSWDPYRNTKGLKVAIVNEDKGTTIMNNKINVGKDVVKSLKVKPSLGWVFVKKDEASEGVKQGKYYASILIPADFSEKISTVLSDHPIKPILVYQVNEKLNIVAPKYTEKGATGIANEITKKFEKVVSKEVLNVFNKIGVDLQANLPLLMKTEKAIFLLERDMPEIEKDLKIALNDLSKVQKIIQTANKDLQLINQIASNGEKLTTLFSNFLTNIHNSLQNATPYIQQTLNLLKQNANTLQNTSNQLKIGNLNNEDARKFVNEFEKQLTNTSVTLDSFIKFLQTYNRLNNSNQLANEINRLQTILSEEKELQNKTNQMKEALMAGNEVPNDLLQQVDNIATNLNDQLNFENDRFNTEFLPNVNRLNTVATNSINELKTVLDNTKKNLPAMQNVLKDAAHITSIGNEELQNIVNDLPMLRTKIHQLANDIRDAKKKGNLNDLIDFLRTDSEKVSNFYSNPIELKVERMFPIPNYGTGMSPFYTTLSLWVGVLLLVSLLTTEVHEEKSYKSSEVYFGRFLTFVSITVLQSFIVTTGDFFLLGTYATSKVLFILFGLFISIVFTFIVYTLVSIFGNVGKGMSIILLVLQISAAGGVYPVQVTPPFFQKINPFLPFTYAISLLREATGGIVWSTARKDLLILFLFILLAILIGLLLKGPINKKAKRIMERSKESKIIH